MWKFEPFLDFVSDMAAQMSVGEIIIIDNAPNDTPSHPVLGHPKVKKITFGRNIYVNPAWNKGVELSQFDRLCIVNDDIIFDLKLFNRMLPFVSPTRGAFGISPGVKDTDQAPVTTGEINLVHSTIPYNYRSHLGFGMLMMCHKHNWVPIIDGLDIYWGDNYIYDTQFFALNQNWLITNMFHYTPYATTCSKLENVNEFMSREHMVYNREMPSIIENIRRNNNYRTGL